MTRSSATSRSGPSHPHSSGVNRRQWLGSRLSAERFRTWLFAALAGMGAKLMVLNEAASD